MDIDCSRLLTYAIEHIFKLVKQAVIKKSIDLYAGPVRGFHLHANLQAPSVGNCLLLLVSVENIVGGHCQ